MLATLYTPNSLPYPGMRNRLHKESPQKTLADRLAAIFRRLDLSSRGVAKKVGVSNRTVQNMVNGSGNPGLANVIAVAKHVDVPLWQLLCPSLDPTRAADSEIRTLVEQFCTLSDLGRHRVLQNLEDVSIAEAARKQAAASEETQNSI